MNFTIFFIILILVISVLVILLVKRGFLRLDGIETGPPWLKVKLKFTEVSKPKHNLPQPTYGQFIGREKEIAQIKIVLRSYPHSQHSVISIDGIGGVGKSTLALEIAHWYMRNYSKLSKQEQFDAIVWVSAKESILTADGILPRYKKQSTLVDIMQEINYTLSGETNREGIANISDLRAKTFSLLSSHRALLIIDNFESIDDISVMSFIFEVPAPTKIIVTTRHRIDVAYPVRLSGMEWDDAKQLIFQQSDSKIVTLKDEETRLLYKATGGIPLAIVWSIALIGFGYDFHSVIQKLGTTTSDISRFCFGQIIANIQDTPAYKLLGALVLLENASRERLGYIAQLPIIQRDEGLVHLEKLSLVNRTLQGKFSVSPLVSEYILQIMEPSLLRHLENMVTVLPFFEIAPADEELFKRQAKHEVRIPIGKTIDGNTFHFVLGSSTDAHALILGTTGAGKTEMIKTLILNGLLHYQEKQVGFVFIDSKGGRLYFPGITGVTEFDTASWYTNYDSHVQQLIDYLEKERESRYSLMAKYSVANFFDVNEAADEILIPRLVIIIDEVSLLIDASDKFKTFLDAGIRLGRGLGIHYVFVTQSITSSVSKLLPHIGARYVFRVAREEELRLALGGEFPMPRLPGEALYMGERGFASFRIAYLTDTKPYLDILKQKRR
jgi:Cdc6-like AAA superfamily ATPase